MFDVIFLVANKQFLHSTVLDLMIKIQMLIINNVLVLQLEDEGESDVEYVMEDEIEEDISDLEVNMLTLKDSCSQLLLIKQCFYNIYII